MSTLRSILRQASLLALALGSSAVFAAAGTVTHLSGTLSVQRADGSVRILSQKSEVNPGDLLTTQRDSYAQINMTDGSSMTMRPDTQLRIERFTFVQDRPQDDSSFLRLVKGGLRTVTGLVGKRGNQDAYRIGTNTATIGIRGSSGTTCHDAPECQDVTLHATYTSTYLVYQRRLDDLSAALPPDVPVVEVKEGEVVRVGLDRLERILPGDPGFELMKKIEFDINQAQRQRAALGGGINSPDGCVPR